MSDVLLYFNCRSLYIFSAQVSLAPRFEASGNSDLSSCNQWSNLELETDSCIDTSVKSGRRFALGFLEIIRFTQSDYIDIKC